MNRITISSPIFCYLDVTWPFDSVPRIGEKIEISSIDDYIDTEKLRQISKNIMQWTYDKSMLWANLTWDEDNNDYETEEALAKAKTHTKYIQSFALYNITMKFIRDKEIKIRNNIFHTEALHVDTGEISEEHLNEYFDEISDYLDGYFSVMQISQIYWNLRSRTVDVYLDFDPAQARPLTEEEKENLETYIHKI